MVAVYVCYSKIKMPIWSATTSETAYQRSVSAFKASWGFRTASGSRK